MDANRIDDEVRASDPHLADDLTESEIQGRIADLRTAIYWHRLPPALAIRVNDWLESLAIETLQGRIDI